MMSSRNVIQHQLLKCLAVELLKCGHFLFIGWPLRFDYDPNRITRIRAKVDDQIVGSLGVNEVSGLVVVHFRKSAAMFLWNSSDSVSLERSNRSSNAALNPLISFRLGLTFRNALFNAFFGDSIFFCMTFRIEGQKVVGLWRVV